MVRSGIKEIEIMEIERNINAKVRKQIDKTQKEYYLREQLKAIQNELGDKDGIMVEAEEYKEKLKKSVLNEEVENYPDYASALYFVGDGADTCGNSTNIKRFLGINEAEYGFGEHMYSAILLGDERQRRELSDIFGDDHTTVAPNFETLIEQSMDKFEQDLEEYLRDKT